MKNTNTPVKFSVRHEIYPQMPENPTVRREKIFPLLMILVIMMTFVSNSCKTCDCPAYSHSPAITSLNLY
jgi:hypothetical protein